MLSKYKEVKEYYSDRVSSCDIPTMPMIREKGENKFKLFDYLTIAACTIISLTSLFTFQGQSRYEHILSPSSLEEISGKLTNVIYDSSIKFQQYKRSQK